MANQSQPNDQRITTFMHSLPDVWDQYNARRRNSRLRTGATGLAQPDPKKDCGLQGMAYARHYMQRYGGRTGCRHFALQHPIAVQNYTRASIAGRRMRDEQPRHCRAQHSNGDIPAETAFVEANHRGFFSGLARGGCGTHWSDCADDNWRIGRVKRHFEIIEKSRSERICSSFFKIFGTSVPRAPKGHEKKAANSNSSRG